jgi:hypothetical protein
MCSDQSNNEVMLVVTVDRCGFMTRGAALVGLVLLPAMLHSGFARAASTDSTVAGLVMELSGVTKPPLVVHREVTAGTEIAIGQGAHLSLLHYATCSIVSFSGGTVKVTEQGLEAADANIESRKRGPCPRVHKISLAGPGAQGGVIVSRGIDRGSWPYVEIASDGLVVITGAEAANAVSADVLDGDRKLVNGEVSIHNESFRLNGGLAPRRSYFISIHFGGRSEPVEVPISISASNAKGLLILRLE